MPNHRTPADTPRQVIHTAAVVFLSPGGSVLGVRKRGTTRFMQPGGKPEPGETMIDTAIREIHEEIGVALRPDELSPLGVWQVPAANEPDTDVHATVFLASRRLTTLPETAHEIVEARWCDPRRPLPDSLAPLYRDAILPELWRRGMIPSPGDAPSLQSPPASATDEGNGRG